MPTRSKQQQRHVQLVGERNRQLEQQVRLIQQLREVDAQKLHITQQGETIADFQCFAEVNKADIVTHSFDIWPNAGALSW